MSRYFQTKGIYGKVDVLEVTMQYDPKVGYEAQVRPCYLHDGMISYVFAPEYYQFYQTLHWPLLVCLRQSKKRRQEACRLVDEQIDFLLEKYVRGASLRGGIDIEIVGEITESKTN